MCLVSPHDLSGKHHRFKDREEVCERLAQKHADLQELLQRESVCLAALPANVHLAKQICFGMACAISKWLDNAKESE